MTWSHAGSTWTPSSTPPACPDPLILPSPTDVSRATGVLYPGQVRGGHYKAHGGLRFPNSDPNVRVSSPMDAVIVDGVRYLTPEGVVQYMFDVINSCGIWHRFDHLYELSPRFRELAETLPAPTGSSMTTLFPPGLRVEAGELIATKVGVPEFDNIFFDWGVYDLRQQNASSADPGWLAAHPGEQAPYAICWIEFLSDEERSIVGALPTGIEGAVSDYCTGP